MHLAKLSLYLLAALTVCPFGYAEERSAPLDPVTGFELRLLDKKFPVQITAGGKTEEHDAPIWVFMPEQGLPQASLDALTQPADMDGGTAILPAPPDGFGLRAMKLPIRESFVLADGRQVIVEIPVFIYFRRVEARLPTEAAVDPPEPHPNPSEAADKISKAEVDALRAQLVDLHEQFSTLIPLLDEGTAKDRLKILVQHLGDLTTSHDTKVAYNQDGSIDYNLKSAKP
jgi:hypothetical protein